MTNGLLYQWHMEVNALQSSLLMYLLKGRLADFYKDYGVRINTIIERKEKLQKEYFVFEGDQIKKTGETFVTLEGKTYEGYIEKYKELMDEKISSLVTVN